MTGSFPVHAVVRAFVVNKNTYTITGHHLCAEYAVAASQVKLTNSGL